LIESIYSQEWYLPYHKHEGGFTMLYSTAIGIDAHSKTNTICAFDPRTGDMREVELPADPTMAIGWIKAQDFEGSLMSVYESGPTGFVLARALQEAGIPCMVAAVSKMPERKDKMKNDKEDARWLARQLVAGMIKPVTIPSTARESMRNISRLRDETARALRGARQRVSSFLLLMGVVYSDGKRWTQKFQKWAESYEFSEPIDTYVFREKLAEAYRLEGRLEIIEARLKEAVASDPELFSLAARLECIHGIGQVTAYAFVCEAGDISRFKNGAAFSSYLGLVPSEDSTGDINRRGKITKQGNKHLRRLLIEAAGCYSRKCRLDAPDNLSVDPLVRQHAHKCSIRLKKRRDALAKRKKQANKAKVAIAREMAEWIYHIAIM
jgi:transposase